VPVLRYWGRKSRWRTWATCPALNCSKRCPRNFRLTGTTTSVCQLWTVGQPDGSRVLELGYREHRITPGKPRLPGLPSTYVESDDEAETLEIDLVDTLTGLTVTLFYSVFRNFDAITRSVRIVMTVAMSSNCLTSSAHPWTFQIAHLI